MSAIVAIFDDDLLDDGARQRLAVSMQLLWTLVVLFAVALAWAWLAELDEVSTGQGRIVPTSLEQVVQSLEGGIIAEMHVKQDDLVDPGQILARLDPTQAGSTVEESEAKYHAALGAQARLSAEVADTPLRFPEDLRAFPSIIASETRLYNARRSGLAQSIALIDKSLALINRQVAIGEQLTAVGAASTVEVIKLKREQAEFELRKADLRSQYLVEARQELARVSQDVNALAPVVRGRSDTVQRLILRSPVRGVVKSLAVSTIGGVVPPNGEVMRIVPRDDRLLTEARISPRDIAFIHPGQRASIKITAYDYSIYGGLEGEVVSISADTIRDEANPDIYYYRVYIRSSSDRLINKAGRAFPIAPGMVATVDIHTGSKTVLQYLLKPLNRVKEALRER